MIFTCSMTLGKLPFLTASFLLFQLGILMTPTSLTWMVWEYPSCIIGDNNSEDLKLGFILIHIYVFIKNNFVSCTDCLNNDLLTVAHCQLCEWCFVGTQTHHPCTLSACGFLCAAGAELSSCDSHHLVHKAAKVYQLALYRKRLLTSGLNYKSKKCIFKKLF